MELIKQIKEAETNAKQIIEQAKADAVRIAEQAYQERTEKLKEAQDKRKIAIEQAVVQAEKSGAAQAETLKNEAKQEIQQLKSQSESKMSSCVDKVLNSLKEN